MGAADVSTVQAKYTTNYRGVIAGTIREGCAVDNKWSLADSYQFQDNLPDTAKFIAACFFKPLLEVCYGNKRIAASIHVQLRFLTVFNLKKDTGIFHNRNEA